MLKVARITVTNQNPGKSVDLGGLMPKLITRYSGAPATCDVTFKADGFTILTLTDNNTDRADYPTANHSDTDGTALDTTTPHVVNRLSVSLAGGDSDTVVTVEAYYYAD